MTNCPDCGVCVVADTGPVENYMLRDEVWKSAGLGYLDGFLCVECLESRLGRPLTGADLDISLPINYPGMQRDTPRLFSLKSDLWSGIDMDDIGLLESLLCPRRSAS